MKKNTNTYDSLVNFLWETGLLKRVKRSGWWVCGVKDPESVADHSLRCAVLGYLLARLEKADPLKVFLMTVFGDIHEARTTDLHKMAQMYFDVQTADQKAYAQQSAGLPAGIRAELLRSRNEYVAQKSIESIVARDADILECLLQAREYSADGYASAHAFTKKAPRFLRTRSARLMWRRAQKSDPAQWWRVLSSFNR